MSTAAKFGLVTLVLVLIAIFGYTQLGSKPTDYSTDMSNNSTTTGEEKASGSADEAVNVMVAGALSEDLIIAEESADADLIDSDAQAVSDLGQSINDNDF